MGGLKKHSYKKRASWGRVCSRCPPARPHPATLPRSLHMQALSHALCTQIMNAMLALWPPTAAPSRAASAAATAAAAAPGTAAPSASTERPPTALCGDGRGGSSLGGSDKAGFPVFEAYCANFLGEGVVRLLLANAVDSWEKLRQVRVCAHACLCVHVSAWGVIVCVGMRVCLVRVLVAAAGQHGRLLCGEAASRVHTP